ncbi:Protocatechuate 3,4-dioxygenase beta subunit [Asanoa hainanensis]|uniref:Protocatechuate 3,4-dioxygenase beta subunit n=1 Tax=Asanoa hainanensis TaxID=560556 RepID=A0A239J6R6_9ACTN|nr:intradiol ring-cleavage dioxygenase [Asanoa hainanensis]SNT01520.1 Protocatechuate 3,4-dioxygenase beta subunit [Asanoa hainanensis]
MHQHDQGLSLDLPTLLSRRRVLGLFTAAGAAAVAGCAPGKQAETAAVTATGTEIPEETAGPFPGDGSNGVNVLTESGIVRSDLTRSFGTATGVATGVPLTIALTVVDTSGSPRPGAAVYLWHCDQQGRYSLYSNGVEQQNYLRGVQVADAAGKVTFTSVYPAAYDGRWPHIHFEVYADLAKATSAADKLRTSQLALPEEASTKVYATSGYEQSVRNMGNTSLETDMVFSDGYSLQLGTVTGDVEQGLTVTLSVPV